MSYSKLGLKEIIFLNSGHFKDERIKVDDFSLLLGSSGVGKTTILGTILYFYILDAKKTSEKKRDEDFLTWHCKTDYSHLIYIYENHLGRNMLIVSKGKKHTFVNINSYKDELELLYKDEDKNFLNLSEILERCVQNDLYYYTASKLTLFKRLMTKMGYKSLPTKDKPDIDFSFFEKEENVESFGKYLYSIYANSSAKDKDIKDMLISLTDEKGRYIDLHDFKDKLKEALLNVVHFDRVKSLKNKILELDDNMENYKGLNEEILKLESQLDNLLFNTPNALDKLQDDLAIKGNDELKLTQKQNILKEEFEKKRSNLDIEISNIINKVESYENEYNTYKNKYHIDTKIQLQAKEEELETTSDKLGIQIAAINSSIEEIDSKEQKQILIAKQKLDGQKSDEKKELESKRDILSQELSDLLENKNSVFEEATRELDGEIKIKEDEYNLLDKEHSNNIIRLENLPKQNLESSLSIKYGEEIKRLAEEKKNIDNMILELQSQKIKLEEEKEFKLNALSEKLANEVKTYEFKKDTLETQIKDINEMMKLDRENLFAYLENNDVPNKNLLLSTLNKDILFSELGFKFEIIDSSDTVFGLKVDGQLDKLSKDFDLIQLDNKKQRLLEEKSQLAASHTVTYKNIDADINSTGNKYNKNIKEIVRKINPLESNSKRFEINIKNEEKALEEEILRLKTNKEKEILNLKVLNESNGKILKSKLEYLEKIRQERVKLYSTLSEEYNLKIQKAKSDIKICKSSLDRIDKKYEKLLSDAIQVINTTFKDIKEAKGIDVEELKNLTSQKSEVEKNLEAINKNRALVETFKDKIEPNYKSISDLNLKKSTLLKDKEEVIAYYSSELKILEKDIETIKKKINTLKYKQEMFEAFENKCNDLGIRNNKVNIPLTPDEIDELLESNPNSVIEKYENTITNEKLLKSNIMNKTRSIVEKIPEGNSLNLKSLNSLNMYDDEDIEQYMVIAKEYVDFIKTRSDVEGTNFQLSSLSNNITNEVERLHYIKQSFNSVNKSISKINSTIREGIKGISVIEHIELKFVETGRDAIVGKIENLRSLTSENVLIVNEQSQRAEDYKNELISKCDDLVKDIEKNYPLKSRITVSEISTLSFDVKENDSERTGVKTLDNLGSNGTTIMAKTIIYTSLLRHVTSSFNSSAEVQLHCVLDEIGQISADYFVELMQYVRDLGFIFINGTAANDDDMISAYPLIYMGERVNASESRMNLVDATDIALDWE